MPIYTAVRHEIPFVASDGEQNSSRNSGQEQKSIEDNQQKEGSWFQWFEITPYEVYCEDLEGAFKELGELLFVYYLLQLV